jgi:hypothetical protein
MFNYSTQASTYLILVIITSIINLICYYIIAGIWGFIGYLLFTLITIPLIILWMYNIDCLTTGDCQIWSWVITALTLISVISTTVLLVAVAVNPSLSSGLTTTTVTTTTELPQLPPPKITLPSPTPPATNTSPLVTGAAPAVVPPPVPPPVTPPVTPPATPTAPVTGGQV